MHELQQLFNRLLGIRPCSSQAVSFFTPVSNNDFPSKRCFSDLESPACWRRSVGRRADDGRSGR